MTGKPRLREQTRALAQLQQAMGKRTPWWRWLLRLVLILSALVIIAVLLFIAFLPTIANTILARRLPTMGMPDCSVNIASLGLHRTVVKSIRLGRGEQALNAQHVTIHYTIAGLRARQIDRIEIDSLDAHLSRDASQTWTLGGLDALPPASPDSDAAPPVAIAAIELAQGRIHIHTGEADLEIGLKATARPSSDWKTLEVDAAATTPCGPLQASATVSLPERNATISCQTDGLDLNQLSPLLGKVADLPANRPEVSGTMGLDVQAIVEDSKLVWLHAEAASAGLTVSQDQPGLPRVNAQLNTVKTRFDLVARAEGITNPPWSIALSSTVDALAFQATVNEQNATGNVSDVAITIQVEGNDKQWDSITVECQTAATTLQGMEAQVALASLAAEWKATPESPLGNLTARSRVTAVSHPLGELGEADIQATWHDQILTIATEDLPISLPGTGTAHLALNATATRDAASDWQLQGQLTPNQVALESQSIEVGTIKFAGSMDNITLSTPVFTASSVPEATLRNIDIQATLGTTREIHFTADMALNLTSSKRLPEALKLTQAPNQAALTGTVHLDTTPDNTITYDLKLTVPQTPLAATWNDMATSGKADLTFHAQGDLKRAVTQMHVGFSETDLTMADKGTVSALNGAVTLDACELNIAALQRELGSGEFSIDRILNLCPTRGNVAMTAKTIAWGPDLTVADLGINLPFSWLGKKGFKTSEEQAPVVISWTGIKAQGMSFAGAEWQGKLAGRQAVLTGPLATADGSLNIEADAALTLAGTPGIILDASALVPNLQTARWLNARIRALGQIEIEKLTGQASAKLHLEANAKTVKASAAITVADVLLQLTKPEVLIRGINGTLTFADLLALRTLLHQELTFKDALVAKIPINGGTVVFAIESPESFFLEKCEMNWCEGTLTTHAVRFNPTAPDFDIVLYADSIQLARLFELQTALKGEAQGVLYGKIPFSFRDGRVYYSKGFLYSVPGKTGRLKLQNADALTGNLPKNDPRIGQVEKALKDFEFDVFKVDLAGEGETTKMVIRVEGKSATDPTIPPIKLNTNIEAEINDLIDVSQTLKQFGILPE